MFSRAKNPGARKRLALTGFATAAVLTRFARLKPLRSTVMSKGGRPRKDTLRLRAIRVSVRFSPAEHRQLRLLAAVHQVPLYTYLRSTALSLPLPPPVPTINEATYRELCRIGSNVNQIAHLAHIGQGYPGALSTFRTLSDLLLSIKAALRPPRPR